jgi:2-C-methyl-D-erythritol 2,4-cyclodiphosphate synthase
MTEPRPGDARGAFRVGQGFDVHRFSSDAARPLVLGGVLVTSGPGLEGHSDADVVSHAMADALLGAGGLGDIGEHFPDTDPAWEGARSLDLLGRVVSMLGARGAVVMNADCTLVCEHPMLGSLTGEMSRTLEEVVAAPVSVKAKRAEKLGALGRGEGIACLAVALVSTP